MVSNHAEQSPFLSFLRSLEILTFHLGHSSEERNLEVPLGTTFENVQNKFSQTGLDLCTNL